MNDTCEIHVGPIAIVNSETQKTECVIEGIRIFNLDGKEASETLRDIAGALLPFNAVTGEPLK